MRAGIKNFAEGVGPCLEGVPVRAPDVRQTLAH